MRLAKIKLSGFKSFVDPTTLSLPSNLVGIVGPNGCGKSNTIDAVRWVMGESSAKNLRGDSMEDVIFNGSASRKPVGQASIELIFDNSDGTLGGAYAQYSEISIRRQVSRDGQSQYFLNHTRCRRRDITDVFLGTGLGPRSYAIIEQGMISRLIEARPEELRVYLEEAAGISRYKERRRETENRMRHTRENLERLNDVREEVGKQLQHLQRQASTAERFTVLKEEERRTKAELLALRLQALQHEADERQRTLQSEQTKQDAALAQQRHLEAEQEKQRAALVEANEVYTDIQGRYYAVGTELARTEQAVQHARQLHEQQLQTQQQTEAALQAVEQHRSQDQTRLEALQQQITQLDAAHAQAQAGMETLQEHLENAQAEMDQWQHRWDAFNEQAAEPARVAQVERARMEQLERQIDQAKNRLQRLHDEGQALRTDTVEAEINALQARVEQAAEAQTQLDEQLAALLDSLDNERRRATTVSQRLDDTRRQGQEARGRLASLHTLQQAALGLGDAQLTPWLQRHGLETASRLGQQIRVPPMWEAALEMVLGHYLEALCVTQLDTLLGALDDLEQGSLSAVASTAEPRQRESLSAPPASFETPSLLSQTQGPAVLATWLDGIYTVSDVHQAKKLRPALQPGQSLITPDGLWLGHDWLRVARGHDAHRGLLAREQQIQALEAELSRLHAAQETLEETLEQARAHQQDLEAQREQRQLQINQAHHQLAGLNSQLQQRHSRLEQMQQRLQSLNDEREELQESLSEALESLQEATYARNAAVTQMETLSHQRSALQTQKEQLSQRLSMARANTQQHREQFHQLALQLESSRSAHQATAQNLQRLQAQSAQLQAQLDRLSEQLSEEHAQAEQLQAQQLDELLSQHVSLERSLNEARAAVQGIEAQLRSLERQRTTAETEVETQRSVLEGLRMACQEIAVRGQTLQEQLAETAFTLDTLLQTLDPQATIADWQLKVEQLGTKIQRLGAINLAAIEEYKEQAARKTYLDAQYADLHEALETLENAIQKIDRETRARFRDTFEQVSQRFQETFPRLFGGGQAHLQMTGEDLLTTGVAVMVRPPGKRLSTIHLMSGGEKALTAVALVFAIFSLNPAPFCMLDEVDAPLDEANVGRFCKLVREMSAQVQFIFITHNKATMELAEQLIGVTMHEPGVSRLVTVDINEAADMALA